MANIFLCMDRELVILVYVTLYDRAEWVKNSSVNRGGGAFYFYFVEQGPRYSIKNHWIHRKIVSA